MGEHDDHQLLHRASPIEGDERQEKIEKGDGLCRAQGIEEE